MGRTHIPKTLVEERTLNDMAEQEKYGEHGRYVKREPFISWDERKRRQREAFDELRRLEEELGITDEG